MRKIPANLLTRCGYAWLCLAVLDGHPRNFDAIHLVGIRRSQLGGGLEDEALRFRMLRSRKKLDAPEVLTILDWFFMRKEAMSRPCGAFIKRWLSRTMPRR